ncbi:competence type IV pilus major pilin ComGC [Pediococcus claussenii]|uniref:Competence protein GC n=1 Tax=Pediococcus claussenii (strain ATCC BAA-344 / DSM 14800 / JCM 18046 / KCTC 3811 / LMG 21948 / P06) TaxID=701521 RepID=G8PCQ4_PEDCP|nr:competence type IV pilus major pilin ComGC [Pediococcus claussenii]AEV95039.1 competence protein GC [Pediococcus claussenii ATCC BAA-344]ANZ70228.1 competence protein ComGC [Pediococcus claussenii]ANZ72044.1 competence protein ComGC [Pediococcus claussenii]
MKKKKGFTLIEMVVVLFIVSLLILIILPNVSSQRKNAKVVQRDAMTEVVQTQVDLYENEYHELPAGLSDLKGKGYLSDKQFDQATKDGIKIEKERVVKE